MKHNKIHIENLTLRIPGRTQEQGREVGAAVKRQLAERLPAGVRNRRIDTVNLQVTARPGTSSEAMATLIVDAILKGLL